MEEDMKKDFFKKMIIYVLVSSMIFAYTPTVLYSNDDFEIDSGNVFMNLSEKDIIEGGEIVERPNKPLGIKNVTQLQAAQSALKAVSEQTCYDLPAQAFQHNPNAVYELTSIASRVKLIGVVIKFIKRITTEGIYKVQEVHNIAARESFAAVMTAINIFSGGKAVDDCIEKMENLADELMTYPDLTAKDQATVYIKRIFYRDMAEARRYISRYNDADNGDYGVRGKEQYVQDAYREELTSINRLVSGQVRVEQVVEADNVLKSLVASSLLSEEYAPSNKWLTGTADREINEIQQIRNKMYRYFSVEDRRLIDQKLAQTRRIRADRNRTYDKVANAIYDLREVMDDLAIKYHDNFKEEYELVNGNRLQWYAFYLPSPYMDPGVLDGIPWYQNTSFDFEPKGFEPDNNVPLVVGFKNGRVMYGNYSDWRSKRKALKAYEQVVNPDFEDPDSVEPDFNVNDDGGGIVITTDLGNE